MINSTLPTTGSLTVRNFRETFGSETRLRPNGTADRLAPALADLSPNYAVDHMVDVEGCLACDLTTGRRALPGGLIHETRSWRVEHCVGPLGVGTLLVKPKRHVVHVAELTAEEATEQGPLLRQCAIVVDRLLEPEQTYVCLWSHAGGEPAHVHFVVQPITRAMVSAHGLYGPKLQAAMFAAGDPPPDEAVETFANSARRAFADVH